MPCGRLTPVFMAFVLAACADDNELGSGTYEGSHKLRPGDEVTARASDGQVAVFTVGSYTVRFSGPTRTFSESKFGITNTVVTDAWVRVLAAPFAGKVNAGWLSAAAADNAAGVPDILAMATEYFDGAPLILDGAFRPLSGDAGYGQDIGADWNDFVGITWTYPNGTVDPPETADLGNLDCSGYVRMLFGYRAGLPMSVGTPVNNASLPRSSYQMLDWAPGVMVIPYADRQATNLSRLRAGDLVFFDTDADAVIDHVGFYLGIDTAGHHRMLNSRNSMSGPTMRDGAGAAYGESPAPSILDGTSYFARGLRAARRL